MMIRWRKVGGFGFGFGDVRWWYMYLSKRSVPLNRLNSTMSSNRSPPWSPEIFSREILLTVDSGGCCLCDFGFSGVACIALLWSKRSVPTSHQHQHHHRQFYLVLRVLTLVDGLVLMADVVFSQQEECSSFACIYMTIISRHRDIFFDVRDSFSWIVTNC